MHFHSDTDHEVQELIQRSEAGNAALMRGDVEQRQALLPRAQDFTLMSPFGGKPTHGPQLTPEAIEAMATNFKNGILTQEVVQTYASADMVVLAVIERSNVGVGRASAWNRRRHWRARGVDPPRHRRCFSSCL